MSTTPIDEKDLPEWYHIVKRVLREFECFSQEMFRDIGGYSAYSQLRYAADREAKQGQMSTKPEPENERVYLSQEQAEAMLPDGELIHTFLGQGPILVGADWTREDILSALKTGKPELSGPEATKRGHGLCFYQGNEPIFVETKDSNARR